MDNIFDISRKHYPENMGNKLGHTNVTYNDFQIYR